MENTLAVAKALFVMHDDMFHKKIDELRMHKLMYFIQRESLIVNGDILFPEDFLGWKYGPVLSSVRAEFRDSEPFMDIKENVKDETKALIADVLERFKDVSSWRLSIMSHEEFSWKFSRTGLNPSDNGNVHLSIDAMKIDALTEVSNRKKVAKD